MARKTQFTIYDAMEQKGVFDANPANSTARDSITGESLYRGPVEHPKMLYHPLGDEVVTVPAEIVMTPLGPQRVGEQRRIVHKIARDASEERELKFAGWHDHPSKAIRARLVAANLDPSEAPAMSSDQRIKDLETQLKELQAEKADLGAKMLAEDRTSGKALGVKQGQKPGVAEAIPNRVAEAIPNRVA